MHPAPVPGASPAREPVAEAILDDALKLCASHPAAPALAVLELVLQSRCGRPIHFGEVSPTSPFGLLVVGAFDRGMPVSDWTAIYQQADPCLIAALDAIWRKEVWPAFTTHFAIA